MRKHLGFSDSACCQFRDARDQRQRDAFIPPKGDGRFRAVQLRRQPDGLTSVLWQIEPCMKVHGLSLGQRKQIRQDPPKRVGATLAPNMHALRRQKLALLLERRFKGDRGAFLTASGLSKGRLSQLLDSEQPFGDNAARNLEQRLQLEPGYFDFMDARTLEFALAFESLPEHLKRQWETLANMLKPTPPDKP